MQIKFIQTLQKMNRSTLILFPQASLQQHYTQTFFAKREMSECESDHNHLESFDYVAGLAPETPKVYTDCVVCQVNPAKCVILPCRHNCVCLQCLLNLNKCPMCRSVLESYFLVGKDDSREQRDEEELEREQAQVIRQGIAAQVENMFESINNWVGFT